VAFAFKVGYSSDGFLVALAADSSARSRDKSLALVLPSLGDRK